MKIQVTRLYPRLIAMWRRKYRRGLSPRRFPTFEFITEGEQILNWAEGIRRRDVQ